METYWSGAFQSNSTCNISGGIFMPPWMVLYCLLSVTVTEVNRPFYISKIRKSESDDSIYLDVSDSTDTVVGTITFTTPGVSDTVCLGIVHDKKASGTLTARKEFYSWLSSLPSYTELAKDALILSNNSIVPVITDNLENGGLLYNNQKVVAINFDSSFTEGSSSSSSSSSEETGDNRLKGLTLVVGSNTYTIDGNTDDIVGLAVGGTDSDGQHTYACPIRTITNDTLKFKRLIDR